MLDDARRRLSDGVKACHEANLDARELVLDRELLKGILAGVPRDTSMPISHCFATQAADMPDGLRLVINRIYSGFSHLYSRFLWLLSKGDANSGITRLCREQLIAMQPPDAVFVQLPGGVDTNLNIYPELAAYEITFPGGRCTRPLSEQIAVTDLFIRHDPVKDRLELRQAFGSDADFSFSHREKVARRAG